MADLLGDLRRASLLAARRDHARTTSPACGPTWVYQAQEAGGLQTTPLVADGVMYITEARSRVAALDVRTGRTLWRYEPAIPSNGARHRLRAHPTAVSRCWTDASTSARSTRDLVALDAVSGAVRWTVQVADNALGYAITSAPLAIAGKIIIGVSGGEAGVRGFVDAYDAGDRRAGLALPHRAWAWRARDTTRGAATAGRPAARRPG